VIENTSELCYLTHVVFRMFEDLDKHEDDPTRFRIEILFSPGCTAHPPAVAER
jgi:inositol hexakisphosphate/diphosphoinositol-pentakisphosphate kinase